MHYIVDRIESGIAICNCMSTGETMEIKASELPPKTKEGDILAKDGGKYVYDEELSQKRLARLRERVDRLFERQSSPS